MTNALDKALLERDVPRCFALLGGDSITHGLVALSDEDAVRLLLCVTQIFDLGYQDPSQLERYLTRTHNINRAAISAVTFFQLRMIEAYRNLAIENVEECIAVLEGVLNASNGLLNELLLFLANFWKGRAHRKRGDYAAATIHFAAARQNALIANAPKLIAVTQIHESWLAFQRADLVDAFKLLDSAERQLKNTGHDLALGNIESARGRFVHRSGDYSGALAHFQQAIVIYSVNFSQHPNLARTLVNAAYVKQLMALDLRPSEKKGSLPGKIHARSRTMRNEASELLEQASDIYARHHHQGGTGSVLVNAAHLHLEGGDIANASIEAERAFRMDREKQDQILMARARIAQAASELAQAEEQLGEDPDVARHAHLADEAITLATGTQNKRLCAEAYLARGFVAAFEFFGEWEVANELATKAGKLLSPADRDHLYKSFTDLMSILIRVSNVDEKLQQWSTGQFGSKSLTQLQEEFAEFVISNRLAFKRQKYHRRSKAASYIAEKD